MLDLPSPEPKEREAALKWFRERISMEEKAWEGLSEQAKRRAFSVVGVTHLELVNTVFKAIEQAIEKGTDFEEFKKAVSYKLQKHWKGENPDRLETIFINECQLAYNAGRFYEFTKENALKERPYWQFDARMDEHSSSVCPPLEGTTLEALHKFWKEHFPPLHHRCRSTVNALSQSDAEKAGIAGEAPSVGPHPGWGRAPELTEWEPDKGKYPPELWERYEKWRQAQPPRFAPPKSLTTVDELVKWGRSNWPLITWDMDGVHPDLFQDIAQELYARASEFPGAMSSLRYIGTYKNHDPRKDPAPFGKAHAHTVTDVVTGTSFMGLNPASFGDPKKFRDRLKMEMRRKWNPQGCDSVKYVVCHEFGHLVDVWRKDMVTLRAFFHIQSADGRGLVGPLMALWDDQKKADPKLSEYSQDNRAEGFAEAFAALYYGAPKANFGSYPKDVRKMLDWVLGSDLRPMGWAGRLEDITDPTARKAAEKELERAVKKAKSALGVK